jgi:hypothetical protein
MLISTKERESFLQKQKIKVNQKQFDYFCGLKSK